VTTKELDYLYYQPPASAKTKIEAMQPLHCPREMHAQGIFYTCFYGFFRASELTSSLNWSDIMLQSDQMSITLNQSKTDPFQCGQAIHIFATQSSTCLIRAMDSYTQLVDNAMISIPVFNVGRFNPLIQNKLNKVIRHLLQQEGINQTNYGTDHR